MLQALYIANNPGARAARMMRATRHLVEWKLVSRAPLRVELPGLEAHHWQTVEELKQLLEQPWALATPLWLTAQQLDCEWLPPFASLCRGPNRDVRIVVDVRDMTTLIPRPTKASTGEELRLESISLDELSTFRIADGIIHISGQIGNACEMLHRQVASTPGYVLPCFVGKEELLEPWEGDRVEGVVYAGGLGPAGPTFRAYTDLFEALAVAVPVHVYASPTGANGQEIMDQYTVRGCHVHPRVPDEQLVDALRRHRWGFVGFPRAFPLGNGALPNKLFEYFAAGLPVVVVHADAAGELVQTRGLGIWVRSQGQFEMLPEMLSNVEMWQLFQHNVLSQREELTMDARADGLVGYFRRVLKRKQTRPGGLRIALQSVTIVDAYGPDVDLEQLFGKAS